MATNDRTKCAIRITGVPMISSSCAPASWTADSWTTWSATEGTVEAYYASNMGSPITPVRGH